MIPELREQILRRLAEHRIMTLATNRSDGWPQATTVSYISEGLNLYCFIARVGQKFANLLRDPRVSVAIAHDFSKPEDIKGLSLAGKAKLVESRDEYDRVCALLIKRFPEYAAWPSPNPAFAPLFRIEPEVVSVLDYSKGFGHSDLVSVTKSDLKQAAAPKHHDWLGHGAVAPAAVVRAVRPSGWAGAARFFPSHIRSQRG